MGDVIFDCMRVISLPLGRRSAASLGSGNGHSKQYLRPGGAFLSASPRVIRVHGSRLPLESSCKYAPQNWPFLKQKSYQLPLPLNLFASRRPLQIKMKIDINAGSDHFQSHLASRLAQSVGDSGNHGHRTSKVLRRFSLSPPFGFDKCLEVAKLLSHLGDIIVSFLPFVNKLRQLFLFCFRSILFIDWSLQNEILSSNERRI